MPVFSGAESMGDFWISCQAGVVPAFAGSGGRLCVRDGGSGPVFEGIIVGPVYLSAGLGRGNRVFLVFSMPLYYNMRDWNCVFCSWQEADEKGRQKIETGMESI